MSNLLSLAALARRLDLPIPRAVRLLRDGVLVPDAKIGRMHAFSPDRLTELRQRVEASAGAVK